MNLYDILGVKPDASIEEIKKTYRKKSMELHPDKGGNPDEFSKLQEAYSILSDSKKRQYYDETGNVETNTESMLRSALISLFFAVVKEITNDGVDYIDIIVSMRNKCEVSISNGRSKIDQLDSQIKLFTTIKGRLKAKKGKDNIFVPAIENNIILIEQRKKTIDDAMETNRKCLEMLSDYNYETIDGYLGLGGMFETTTTGSSFY